MQTIPPRTKPMTNLVPQTPSKNTTTTKKENMSPNPNIACSEKEITAAEKAKKTRDSWTFKYFFGEVPEEQTPVAEVADLIKNLPQAGSDEQFRKVTIRDLLNLFPEELKERLVEIDYDSIKSYINILHTTHSFHKNPSEKKKEIFKSALKEKIEKKMIEMEGSAINIKKEFKKEFEKNNLKNWSWIKVTIKTLIFCLPTRSKFSEK